MGVDELPVIEENGAFEIYVDQNKGCYGKEGVDVFAVLEKIDKSE